MSDWKKNFWPDMARAALDPDLALSSAFIWDSTPEGRGFWREQSKNGLTQEGRARLEEMLREYEEPNHD